MPAPLEGRGHPCVRAGAARGVRVEGPEPSADRYAKAVKCKLGMVVPLPSPLGFDLDTAEF
ncbi:hypothetical protein [Streptomyces sp. 11x1]|uniref:hypothetical protein n=1 Tax=Streptomyces sp. 11x1 TaxID=3038642 RepID=UPI00292F7FA5|nr:hypothetical protein [Streptomyces sp. 11x1]WNZ10076.1 hypothetical protein P8T65_22400 [Streptomyces sp. 11x1]